MVNFYKKKFCRLCRSDNLLNVLELESSPLANAFVNKNDIGVTQDLLPLALDFCNTCKHVQLAHVVDPEVLYKNYLYVSGTSPSFVKHFADYAEDLWRTYNLDTSNFIVEFGSNDCSMLKFFRDKGSMVVGIDPAIKISKEASDAGFNILNGYFNLETAKELKQLYRKADLIIANNVMAHIDNIEDVINGVSYLLEDDGIFSFEVSYLLDVVEKKLFDTIYHEHLDYHSLGPLEKFFSNHGFEIIQAKRVDTHGGSLRVIVQKIGAGNPLDLSYKKLLEIEREVGLDKPESIQGLSNNILEIKSTVKNLLAKIKEEKKTVAIFGAPAKATTLLYHFQIQAEDIEYIVDDSSIKQNLLSPGMHIPILPSTELIDNPVDYVLILAWNFASVIIENNKKIIENGAAFIIPLPELKIVR
jgi:hypothetical protein